MHGQSQNVSRCAAPGGGSPSLRGDLGTTRQTLTYLEARIPFHQEKGKKLNKKLHGANIGRVAELEQCSLTTLYPWLEMHLSTKALGESHVEFYLTEVD